MGKEHHYSLTIEWTGNKGTGTNDYRSYERSHIISAPNKTSISGSSDPAFRGDNTKFNPEELLLASISSCHMLWFLHLCADSGIIISDYKDEPTGIMVESAGGGGHFQEVTLHPKVVIAGSKLPDEDKLDLLQVKANKHCFISNSVNFPVGHQAVYSLSQD
ncbi:MAG: OsmC family protein [Bacteroidia bacterium]|nr:OsmC family protein [Bacteroidia bacterium]